jgi:hypothetical protein
VRIWISIDGKESRDCAWPEKEKQGQIFDWGFRDGSNVTIKVYPMYFGAMEGGRVGFDPTTLPQDGWDMGLGAGGRIKQSIYKDPEPRRWRSKQSRFLNIQILNSVAYEAVTGLKPPPSPITPEEYRIHGIPFFSYYEEKALELNSNAANIRSIGMIDSEKAPQTDIWARPNRPTVCIRCKECFCTTM